MTIARNLAAIAILSLGTVAAPVAAQDYDYVENVRFFEQVVVGDLTVTPFGIRRDNRCADERFCEPGREDTLVVSLVLFDYRGKAEVVLELDRLTPVPGGYLVLRDAGTRPALRGSMPLSEYSLDIEFIPLAG